MPGTTRRVIVLTAWAVYVKPDLSTLVVDLGLTGLLNFAAGWTRPDVAHDRGKLHVLLLVVARCRPMVVAVGS
jgi:uncharacterized membrane protein (Fun14 family)